MKALPFLKHIALPAIIAFGINSCSNSTETGTGNQNTNTSGKKASGRISLSVTCNSTGTWKNGEISDATKVQVTNDLAIDLAEVPIVSSGGVRSVSWQDQQIGGSAYHFEEHKQTLKCNDKTITNVDSTARTYSSTSSGPLPAGVSLGVNPDGSYSLIIAPGVKINATHITHTSWTYCPEPMRNFNERDETGVPFMQYFVPFTGGYMGAFTGKTSSTDPNRINGSAHINDEYVVHSAGVDDKTSVPVEATITWDIMIK